MGITCMGKWCLSFHHTLARMTKKSFQRVKKKFLMGISKLQLLTLIGHHGGKSLLKFIFFTSWSRYQNTLSSCSVILALKKPELQNNFWLWKVWGFSLNYNLFLQITCNRPLLHMHSLFGVSWFIGRKQINLNVSFTPSLFFLQ